MPGERLINITVSDGVFSSSAVIFINVVALNNNPPQITFSGNSNISFIEGQTSGIPLGLHLSPVISDSDDNNLFPMHSAVVELLHINDGEYEELGFDSNIISALGISVNSKSFHLYNEITFSFSHSIHPLQEQTIV